MQVLNKLINNSTIINGNIFANRPGSVGGVQLLLKLILDGGILTTNKMKEDKSNFVGMEIKLTLDNSTYHFTTVSKYEDDLYSDVTFSHIILEDDVKVPAVKTLITPIGILAADESDGVERIRMRPTYYAEYLTSASNKAVIVPTYDGYRYHRLFN